MESKTITATFSEEEIKKRLDDYYSSGYSIKDYCFINEDIDEQTLSQWLQADDDGFMTVSITEEPKRRGRPRQQSLSPSQTLFARIGDIELYHQVSASYLKSLKA